MKTKEHMLATWTAEEMAGLADANTRATAGDMLPRPDSVGATDGDDPEPDGGSAPTWPDDTSF